MIRNILVNGERHQIKLIRRERSRVIFQLNDRNYCVEFEAEISNQDTTKKTTQRTINVSSSSASKIELGDSFLVKAPIPGLITEILAKEGDYVEKNQSLIRLEAMKMQNLVFAPSNGVVGKVFVSSAQEVKSGEILMEIKLQK
jgi:biotin carboxyl carrier protein